MFNVAVIESNRIVCAREKLFRDIRQFLPKLTKMNQGDNID